MLLGFCVVNIKLIPKCLWRTVILAIKQLPRLKQSFVPIISSNIKNTTGGYLYFGFLMCSGSVKSYFDNINSSSGNNKLIFSPIFKNFFHTFK